MIEQMRQLQIEAVLQIRADVIRQLPTTGAGVQITLHGQFPMKAPATRRLHQKIALAKRHARAPQRDVRGDKPRGRSMLKKPPEQTLGVTA